MEDSTTQGISDRVIALWEIVSITSSLMLAEWIAPSPFLAVPAVLGLLLVLISQWLRRERLGELGLNLRFLGKALLYVGPATVVLSLLIVGLGWFKSSLRLELMASRPNYLLAPLWALAQQYVLQAFINRRTQLVWGKGWLSASVVGVLFGLLHLPNIPLAVLTLIAGLWWAFVYQRTPNLFALALSHTVLSLLVALSLPVTWLHSMRVGFKYFG